MLEFSRMPNIDDKFNHVSFDENIKETGKCCSH